MQDTKAIRPEIKGLFDTVKQQSLQYVDAFEQLESYKRQYISMVDDVDKLAESLALKINHEIFSLKQKYDSITKILTIETNKTLDKYKELSSLSQLQDSYNNAIESIKIIRETLDKNTLQLRKDSEEYSRELNHIKINAEKEIKNIINNNDELIRNIIDEEKNIFEVEINSKFKMLDGRLYKVEQSTSSINKQLNTDFGRIYKDIDTLRNLVRNLNKREDEEEQLKYERMKSDIQKIEINLSSLSEELFHLKVKSESGLADIHKKRVTNNENTGQSITAFFGKDYEEEYQKLEKKLNDIEEANNLLQLKYETMKNVAFGAIIISLISAAASVIILL